MKLSKDGKSFAALELSIVIILFILRMSFSVAYFSQSLLLLNLSYGIIIILMIADYALITVDYKKKKAFQVQTLLFVVFIMAFIASYIIQPSLFGVSLLETFGTVFQEYIYILLFFAVFLASIGAYLIRIKKSVLLGSAIFVIVFVLLAIILTNSLHGVYYPDDEIMLSFYGVQFLAHGSNPYNTSIGGILYNSFKVGNASVTMNTENQLASVMPYPSFYFLSSIPFYLLSSPTLYNLEHTDIPIQIAALITLLLVVVLMKIRKEEILKPKFLFAVLLILLAYSITSVTLFLIAVFLFISYFSIGGKYAWLIIGFAISLQQTLWFPCLLLVIYSFNNYGFKKSMQTVIGAALIFLTFNLYFIIINPSAYLGSVLLSSFAYAFPNLGAPIGYLILANYHILIGSLSMLFILVMLLLSLIFAALNRKELILLFSMIPYLFLSHALSAYYALPFLIFVAALYSPQIKEGSGRFTKYLVSSTTARYALYTAIILIAIISILIIYESHLAYTNSFNISITNQSITKSGNATIYSADLVYKNPGVKYVYVGLYGLSQYTVSKYGFYITQVLSNNESDCDSYDCTTSMNKIPINNSASSVRIVATLMPGKNQTIRAVSSVIYNNDYFYASGLAYNST